MIPGTVNRRHLATHSEQGPAGCHGQHGHGRGAGGWVRSGTSGPWDVGNGSRADSGAQGRIARGVRAGFSKWVHSLGMCTPQSG